MKKGIVLLSFFFLVLANRLFALYQGAPTLPDSIENGLFLSKENFFVFKAGYLGDFIHDERLECTEHLQGRVDQFQVERNQGVATVNLYDRVEFFGLAGAARASFSHRQEEANKLCRYETVYHWTAGAGMRVLAFTWGCAALGLSGAYQAAHLPITKIVLNGTPYASQATCKMKQWQLGAALSYQVRSFFPYLGIRYDSAHHKAVHISGLILPAHRFSMEKRDKVGGTVGFGYFPGNRFACGLEVRLVNEQALSLSMDLKF